MTAAKKTAAQREAEGQATVTLHFDATAGDFVLPGSADDWPFTTVAAMEKGRAAEVLEILLGPEQFARFMAANPTTGKAGEFFQAYLVELGLNPGE